MMATTFGLTSCSDDAFDSKYTDPSKTSKNRPE